MQLLVHFKLSKSLFKCSEYQFSPKSFCSLFSKIAMLIFYQLKFDTLSWRIHWIRRFLDLKRARCMVFFVVVLSEGIILHWAQRKQLETGVSKMGFLRFKSFIGWLEGLDDEALVFRIRIEKMFWKSYHSSLSKSYFFTSSCTGGLAFLTRCLAPYKLTGTSDRSCDFLSKAEIAICLLDPICWIKFDICQVWSDRAAFSQTN